MRVNKQEYRRLKRKLHTLDSKCELEERELTDWEKRHRRILSHVIREMRLEDPSVMN